MVSPLTCSINLLVTSSTSSSNPNHLFSQFPRKSSIYLPFTGSHSLQVRTQITRLCSAAYPHLNIRFVFRSSTCISYFFPFKNKVPKFLRSGVVYLHYLSVDAVPHRMWVKPFAIYSMSQKSVHLPPFVINPCFLHRMQRTRK